MKKLFLISILLSASIIINAQEQRVPILPLDNIEIIEQEFAKKNSLFTEVSNFEFAHMFMRSDSSYVLEISYMQSNVLYKDRKYMTLTEMQIFRDSLRNILLQNNKYYSLNQEGRVTNLIGTTIIGLGYYSVAPTIYADHKSSGYKIPTATYMLTAGASFFLPYYLTKDKTVTMPMASMSFHGQTRGLLLGFGLSHMFYQNNTAQWDNMGNYNYNAYEKTQHIRLFSTMAGGIGFGLGQYYLAKHKEFTLGDASVYQMGMDIGLLHGLLYADFFDLYSNERSVLSSVVVSGLAYSALGYYVGQHGDYTVGDAIVMRSAIALGSILPLPIIVAIDPNETKPYTIGVYAGGILGAGLAYYAVQDKNFSTGDGLLVCLGETSGALLGVGTALLLMPKNSGNELNFITTGGTVGSLAGALLLYNIVDGRRLRRKQPDIGMQFNFNPVGLYYRQQKHSQSQAFNLPVCTMKITF